jgi:alpha-D-ribose 1-methylphosphonate 5-triphosphate diphosphatase
MKDTTNGAAALCIEGGRSLIGRRFVASDITVTTEGLIGEGPAHAAPRCLDARGLMVLPGIVDIHGDAFERQMMPRPGVHFPLDIALIDSDRQAVANGITTVFHGVTWSWEPGLRGPDNARSLLTAIERLRSALAADTRFHLRHETYNLDAEEEITDWLTARRIDVLAFNDHMGQTVEDMDRPHRLARMVERSGVSRQEFDRVVERVRRRGNEVPASIARLADTALTHGVPLLSHDDASPEQRRWYRSLGCHVAEFPTTLETAQEAAAAGDAIVFGAPNVVRGGSHTGWTSASEMIARGLCSVLASDYYYPAPLLAAFRLAAAGTAPLEQAWALVSDAPAAAVGLADRGTITPGKRGDLVLVDAANYDRPRLVATIVAGRIVHLNDVERLMATDLGQTRTFARSRP